MHVKKRTVLVNNEWGHVPHRKFLHTLSSDQCRFAFATPIASGPIICYKYPVAKSQGGLVFMDMST